VTVRVDAAPDALSVEVVDDGSATPDHQASEGRGIRGMRERVAALGGVVEAGPQAPRGFRVFARFPYPKGTR
jgi:signal transduction histidine kinase